MGFLKALFGGSEQSPEEERKEQEARNFDLLKYDGVKAMRIGRVDYALKCFEGALALKDDLEVRDYMARALTQTGEMEKAVEQYRLLAEAEPGNVGILLQMAHVAYMMEDYGLMEETCQQALTIDKDNAQAHYFMARACIGQGNLINAVAQLTAAIALHEDYGDAYLLRGQTLLKMGDVKGAGDDADFLHEHAGDDEDVLMLKARVEAAKGNKDEALLIYNKVIDLNPFVVEAYRERGQIKFENGDTAGAKADADKVLELDPQQLADVSGEFSANGIEQKTRQAYSAVNPLGI